MKSDGALRRRIELVSRAGPDGQGEARAAIEDDFHHFRVDIRHDGHQVTHATAAALRFPYTACPEATGQLALLNGMPLSTVANSVTRQTDARIHCTHMLDLAGLAVATAARAIPRRRYDCTVPDRVDGGTRPSLMRDGRPLLDWDVRGDVIVGPSPYAGREIRAGFAGWALKTLGEDEAEAALVLRRAVTISIGRINEHDQWRHARSTGFCYSQQPERAQQAVTIGGSVINWPDAEGLCAADQDFLAFHGDIA